MIVNRETVDPRDPASIPVIQLESAMGAAIGSVPGARAVHVPRSRFAPVKTTDDLLVVRSDAYELSGDGRMSPRFDGLGPVVTLDKDFYKLLSDFGQRFPAGPPSLRRCRRFEVDGHVISARPSRRWATCVWPVRVTFRTGRCSSDEIGCG